MTPIIALAVAILVPAAVLLGLLIWALARMARDRADDVPETLFQMDSHQRRDRSEHHLALAIAAAFIALLVCIWWRWP